MLPASTDGSSREAEEASGKLGKKPAAPSPPSCPHRQGRRTASQRPRPHWTDQEAEAGRKVHGARVLFSTVVHAHAMRTHQIGRAHV